MKRRSSSLTFNPGPLPMKTSLVVAAFCALGASVPVHAQYPPWYPGQRIYWQPAQSPYTPGDGAIMGGPGNDPNPGSPMYICRSRYEGSVQPGSGFGGTATLRMAARRLCAIPTKSRMEMRLGSPTMATQMACCKPAEIAMERRSIRVAFVTAALPISRSFPVFPSETIWGINRESC